MKILAVRFQNLNSLKGVHEIRFDQSPLADAGLFAITGPTGAGKTTILDAITVGLYGQAHRHSTDKPLELMTRHTAEAWAEVEFEANGERYRSKWHIRRSRGKADGKMQAVHMELCILPDEKPFDLKPSQVPDKVAEVCGLDYSQFLRSVMLSQGDFARFLKADNNERSSLLEKITDTGVYSDISRFAFEKAKAERLKKEELERRLADNKLLPEEQLQAYKATITELTEQEEALKQETTVLRERWQWLQQISRLREKARRQASELQEQEAKLQQLRPDFQKLNQHQQAHQYVGELTRIEAANGQLSQVQTQLHTLEKQLPLLEVELKKTATAAEAAGKEQQQQEKAVQELEPLLAQVSRLDHQVNTCREQYNRSKEAYVAFENQLKLEQATLQQKQEELHQIKTQATTLKKWLEQHQGDQELREHLPEFRQTLKDLSDTAQNSRRLQEEQKAALAQLQQEGKQLAQYAAQQADVQKQLHELKAQKEEKLTQLKTLLAARSFEELETAAQEAPGKLQRLEKLLDLSQQFGTQTQKQAQLAKTLAAHAQAVASLTEQLAATEQKQQQAKVRLEDLQKIVVLQQRIQEYEQARQTLQPHQPCPLCGSEHHPFVENNYSSTLSEEEQKRDAQQVLVAELQKQFQQLQLQLNTQLHQQKTDNKASDDAAAEAEKLQQQFEKLRQETELTVSITVTAQLAQLLREQKQEATQLQQTLAQARTCSKALEAMHTRQQELREQQVRTEARQEQLLQSQKLLEQQLQNLQHQLRDLHEAQQAHTEMAASFAATFGLTFKIEEMAATYKALEARAVAFQQNKLEYEKLKEPFFQLQALVQNLKQNTDGKNKELQERKEKLVEEHQVLQQFKAERTSLFGEKDPQQERQLAQQQLRALTNQAEEARAKLLQKQQEIREQQQRQQEFLQEHSKNKSVLEELRQGLLHVLQQEGIATIELLSQMLLDKDEANRLANQKAQTEKHLTELRKSMADVEQELAETQKLALTTASEAELQEQLQEKTGLMREVITKRAQLEQLLDQDAAQRVRLQELATQLHTQQQECNRWEQLNHLIGSADGNKFSRFAQGLTLARLVELANRHLLKLNDRYRILKNSTEDLELQIVDTYQADAVRPMNTLSGGESFLVSLALALGLSDLAGRRTQINSLFIDEGFGTLDAETLDAAVTTLENLQAGGKMIGIISHVEALKERIGTQIKVQKQPGGVSTVEVVGW
ncbi:AAA family ATPase [Botryobacter ruber]|uniref:AAA family ATPase n=1 Tax=Botryobacter ruber TaxID=2171629 RepID=UPI000E0A5840|nr:AAA family ATPase [Botryobacter ruber]